MCSSDLASPIGLPIAENKWIEPDSRELVWAGDEKRFQPRNGAYSIRITEELRELLYLDEAKLVVVDHASGIEAHSTHKLLPSGPYPAASLIGLRNERRLLRAEASDGADLTAVLAAVDGRRASPPTLRAPQLRGLAEPHSITLDFGAIEPNGAFALVLNGWLRFEIGRAHV